VSEATRPEPETVGGTIWCEAEAPPPVDEALRESGLPAWQIELLARRGITSLADAERFLSPSEDDLHSPELLPGIPEAVERIALAAERSEAIAIVGDYDADGISASALLSAVLEACGLVVHCILPHRLEEGYGFQPVHVERSLELGCGLIVTVDCGTTSFAGLASAREAGLDMIVTDHHQPGEPLGEGVIEVNPQRDGGAYPFLELSGAGLALKLAQAVSTRLERPIPVSALLRIACLGTIADLVPLVGENRVIAALGLDAMKDLRSVGLRALFELARIRPPIDASDVGFRIGPRLNAAGRMGKAEPALRLLLTRDAKEGQQLAQELETANTERRATEARATESARERFLDLDPLPRVLIASSPDWHRGVLGIAASRLAREFHRPTLLLEELPEGIATGSGRSVPGVHLYDLIAPSRDGLERFGGHEQAVGMTVSIERLAAFRETLEARAAAWDEALLTPKLAYELQLPADEVTLALIEELDRLEPFGMGNRRPLARVGPMRIQGHPRIFGKGHLSAVVEGTSERVGLLAWNWAERASEFAGEFEVLGSLSVDRYNGSAQIEVKDLRPVGE